MNFSVSVWKLLLFRTGNGNPKIQSNPYNFTNYFVIYLETLRHRVQYEQLPRQLCNRPQFHVGTDAWWAHRIHLQLVYIVDLFDKRNYQSNVLPFKMYSF